MNLIEKLITFVVLFTSRIRKAAFASITYRAKESGELARHRLLLGVSIVKAYRRDLALLKTLFPSLEGIKAVACEELIKSIEESLTVGIGSNSAYTCKDVYETLGHGFKVHKDNRTLYISGFSLGKTVLEKGVFKTVKSSEKTLAKNELRRRLKMGRFRQFIITPENVRRFAASKRAVCVDASAVSLA